LFLPAAVLVLVTGLFADRHDRRTIVAVAAAAELAAAFAFLGLVVAPMIIGRSDMVSVVIRLGLVSFRLRMPCAEGDGSAAKSQPPVRRTRIHLRRAKPMRI
jgi:hypothetical protein